jgi:hypothetical protein
MVTPRRNKAVALRLALPCAALLVGAAGLAAAPAASAAAGTARSAPAAEWPGITCVDREVPVAQSAGQPADLEIWGELCYRGPRAPRTVLLLVPGITYNHAYWDVPGYGGRYSYVDQATAAGYATFDVDPLGTGQSSHPASTEVTVAALAYTMHQVVSALRAGTLGAPAFGHVVYVGQSLGSETGWVEAATYHDVDALVATAALHAFNQSTGAEFDADIVPASADPAFSGLDLDPGYVTTLAGIRGDVFDNPDFVDPGIVAFDEAHKDVGTLTEAADSNVLAAAAPSQAISQGIDVPVLVAVGQDDLINCGGTGGADCSSAQTVTAYEAPYFSPAAHLTVLVAPRAGHDISLAPNAPQTNAEIDTWLWRHVAP